ncbi:PREDICTED: uncharacterized protein LOC109239266 [Nicotiana attenuata]|uniref:uncharacterized protein LOC109239266 n=1 Tax=Nicotiana attenuata TaxID=49451 RepID=UPI0009054E54|nr:PREDICTED: uncharacterized protein LOC109239266 [Nicotiana attenuata]
MSRFISRSSDICQKLFNVLRKDHGLQWNEECIDAPRKLKAYLSSLPLLVKADPGECLLVYLVVSEVALSAVLVRKNKGTQSPIYYISKTIIDAETRYPHLEKLALALVVASRKLRPYFKCHHVKVITTFPLRSILHKPEISGRLAKWAIQLSEHDITYQQRTAIKSQVLADYVADFSAEILPAAEQETLRASACTDLWTLYTDGASNASGSGLGFFLEVPTGEVIRQSVRFPEMANNEAEYEVVIAGLKLALKYGARRLILHCDSQLVVNQVIRAFQIKQQRLQRYQSKIRKLLPEFEECRLNQIPRAQNMEADGLAKLAAATKNINKESVVTLLHSAIDHIEDVILPQDKKEVKKLRVQAARYSLVNHDIYKRTFGGSLAKCLGPHQTRQVLEEVHEGHCAAHTRNRALVRCLIRAGYYWSTMKKKPRTTYGDASNIKSVYAQVREQEKLEEAKGLWPELLPEVLWAYRTTPKSSTGETPYSLFYGTDAVIPVKVGEPNLRYSHISGADNDESRLQDLDEIEERRDMAHVRMIAQKQQMERYYNKKAKLRSLKVGDYVLKAKTLASKDPNEGKLGTNWDGPEKNHSNSEQRSIPTIDNGGKTSPKQLERRPSQVLPLLKGVT